MQNPTYDDIWHIIQQWSVSDRLRLLADLATSVRGQVDTQPCYDVMDFEGIGHGTWREAGGIDEFIKQERASWDKAPRKHKAREFRGSCRDGWKDADVEEYLKQERDSWSDERD